MKVVQLISLAVLIAVVGISFSKVSAMQTKLNNLNQSLVDKLQADKETTRRTQDVERDFRLIRDKLNI